jgi:hypothetical protein
MIDPDLNLILTWLNFGEMAGALPDSHFIASAPDSSTVAHAVFVDRASPTELPTRRYRVSAQRPLP